MRGSVLGLAGPDGDVDTRYTYDPHGATQISGEEDDPNPFAWTGRALDETGLYYHRARYYSPTWGRFLSPDPAGFDAGDTNLYTYGSGDPVNNTDPTGEQAAPVSLAGIWICVAAVMPAVGAAFEGVETYFDITDPDTGPGLGSEEGAIALDEAIRRFNDLMVLGLTICSISLSVSGYGGLVRGNVGQFGRGLQTRLPTVGPRVTPTTSTFGPRALPAGTVPRAAIGPAGNPLPSLD